MSSIHDYYINALLADAAYVNDLTAGIDTITLGAQLKSRMTDPQAQFIAANFEVLSNATTSGSAFTSGFDATVWKGKAGTDYAGKVYVSLRGTAGVADLLSDVDLAANGAARAQYVDMVNWWLKASTPAGSQAKQIQLASGDAGLYFVAAPTVTATGELSGVTHIELDGHSLGGHLATAFLRLFGASVNVDHITTFNSAGFRASSDAVLQQIEGLIGTGTGYFPDASQQTNFFAKYGLNVTTNGFFFNQIGQRVALFNEEGTGVPNHYMYKLTDSLAIADAMSKLDTALTLDKVNVFLEAGSNTVAGSLEGVLDALRRVLMSPSAASTQIGDIGDSAPSRVDLQTNLQALTKSDAFKSLAGKVTLVTPALSANTARSDFAQFLALYYLSPFALQTTDASALNTLKSANQALADQWATDATLTAEQRASGQGNFSDAWLADRAKLLGWFLQANTADSDAVPYSGNELWMFRDEASDRTVAAAPRDGSVPSEQYVIFGKSGADILTGGSEGDRLYGNEGYDTLDGAGGNNYLEGDAGDDEFKGFASLQIRVMHSNAENDYAFFCPARSKRSASCRIGNIREFA